jgi:hypothetical protein
MMLHLTFLILDLNYLIDHGLHARVSIDEVKRRIDRGDVLDWIGKCFHRHVDMCPFLHDRAAYEDITRGLRQMRYLYAHDDRWNWGVANNGICLLLAWTAALMQQHALEESDQCSNCDRTGWVCETHPNRPFKMFSQRPDACECKGTGVPCPVCNTGEPTYLPPEFKAMLDDTGPRH